jgi:hypothetical protein
VGSAPLCPPWRADDASGVPATLHSRVDAVHHGSVPAPVFAHRAQYGPSYHRFLHDSGGRRRGLGSAPAAALCVGAHGQLSSVLQLRDDAVAGDTPRGAPRNIGLRQAARDITGHVAYAFRGACVRPFLSWSWPVLLRLCRLLEWCALRPLHQTTSPCIWSTESPRTANIWWFTVCTLLQCCLRSRWPCVMSCPGVWHTSSDT